MAYLKGRNSDALAAQKYTDEQLRKKYEANLKKDLKEMGKVSAFKEYFESLPLEDQNLSEVEHIEEFIEGRNFGFALIRNGFNADNYAKYIEEKEGKKTKNHR